MYAMVGGVLRVESPGAVDRTKEARITPLLATINSTPTPNVYPLTLGGAL